jgi:hypothetical protein
MEIEGKASLGVEEGEGLEGLLEGLPLTKLGSNKGVFSAFRFWFGSNI